MAPLQEQIYLINERLRSFGIESIQEIKMTDREGKQIGQIKYGLLQTDATGWQSSGMAKTPSSVMSC